MLSILRFAHDFDFVLLSFSFFESSLYGDLDRGSNDKVVYFSNIRRFKKP